MIGRRGSKSSENKINDVFDRTLFAVREVCSNTEELKIPIELKRNERDKAVDVLIESIRSLTDLLSKIRRGDREDGLY